MSKKSAGLLLFRDVSGTVEVLLVHPGGPFWAKKDEGAWSIPKGEFSDDEDPFHAALREFEEEMGGAVKSDFAPARLRSNTFSMEWPPCSGRQRVFPEIDRAAWFPLDAARAKISKGQVGFLDELESELKFP